MAFTGAAQGDPSCWQDGFNYTTCCETETYVVECFDHIFTWERCCELSSDARDGGPFGRGSDASTAPPPPPPPPPPSAAVGGFRRPERWLLEARASLDSLYEPVYHYNPREATVNCAPDMLALARCRESNGLRAGVACWEELRTFGGCCKSFFVAKAAFPLAHSALRIGETSVEVVRTLTRTVHLPGLLLCAPAAVISLMDLAGVGGRPRVRKPAPSRASIPFASNLRAMITLLTMTFHIVAGRPHHDRLVGTLILCVDVFFVLSAYLAAAPLQVRSGSKAEALSTRVRCVGADAAAAVLRRVARTAPTFLVIGCLDPGGMLSHLGYGHRGWGLLWIGPPWPFALELLCLFAIRLLLVPVALFGDAAGLVPAAVLLAACVEYRLQHGYKSESLALHGALIAHRLPQSILSLLLARLLGRAEVPFALGGSRHRVLAALAVAARAAGVAGIVTTVACELSRGIIAMDPAFWFLHPFFYKVPLLCGCVLLLEVSRRVASGPGRAAPAEQAPSPLMAALEGKSLQLMVVHVAIYICIDKHFPSSAATPEGKVLEDWVFYLPMTLVWSVAASAVLAWAQAPYQRALESLVGAVHRVACNPRPGGDAGGEAADAALVLSQIAALALVVAALLCAVAAWMKTGFLSDTELL